SQAAVVAITATARTGPDAAHAADIFASTALRVRRDGFLAGLTAAIDRIQRQIVAIPAAQRATSVEYSALAQKLGVLKSYVGSSDPTLQLVARASVPTAPSWPRTKLSLAAALIASLLLGCGIAVLLEVANPTIGR